MNKRYQISYYLRIVLIVAVYLIFFAYIIYSCLHAKDSGAVIFNILIGILLGGVGLLYEYLRICYDAATKRLIIDGKPQQTLKLLDLVEKADLLKSFKTSCQMMRMLSLIDLRDFASFKEYDRALENNDYDVEIVRKYCAMIAEGEHGNKGKSNEAFKQLVAIRDIKDKKGRRNKGAFYFNWEVVIPYHHDLWTNFQADTKEILVLWYMRKNRLQYKFKPFIWEVGDHFTFPDDKDKIEYHHFRGFDDVFTEDINLPFPSFL